MPEDKLPNKDDLSRLVYCVATIQEVQRISCVAPATLMHATTQDVEVKGYKINKGTRIIANLTKFMNDPDVFFEPNKFIPERFVEEDNDDSGLHMRLKVGKC